jgi:uncharacterized peroxidase-related enzyme
LLQRVEHDWRRAGLNAKRLAMLDYVERLTLTPHAVRRSNVESLFAVGFTDLDVLHIAEVASYYAYVNRIADGLGVLLEGPPDDSSLG